MAYHFTTIDGCRVEVHVADALARMDAAFHKAFGLHLRVRQGSRTRAEQTRIFLERYVVAGEIRGRYVYDIRRWSGKLWYRISNAGTVAAPGESNHEIDGPNGPRSVDIYDTGGDAGVTVRGTVRDRWMQENAGKFGFENEGYLFNEAWHKTFRGKIGGALPQGDKENDVDSKGLYDVFLKGQRADGDPHYLWLDEAHHNSVAFGKCYVWGSLAIGFTTTGKAPAGEVYQVESYVETVANGRVTKSSGLGIHEVIPTGGKSMAQIVVPYVGLNADQRLRFRVWTTGGLKGKVAYATFRGGRRL